MYSSSSANSVTACVMRSDSPDRVVERERVRESRAGRARCASRRSSDTVIARHVAGVDRRRRAQQAAHRVGEALGLVGLAGRLERDPAQLRRQRRGAVAVRPLGGEPLVHPLRRRPELAVLEQPREQLLGRLLRARGRGPPLLGGQHQARLQLQQRRDQDQELGRRLEVQLAARLEPLDVGEHDLGEVDLEQVDVLVQDQRDEQVERPLEDVEVEGDRPSASPVGLAGDGSVRLTAPSPPWRAPCSAPRSRARARRPRSSIRSSSPRSASACCAALAERPQVLDDPLGDLVLVLAAAELAGAAGAVDLGDRGRPACRTASRRRTRCRSPGGPGSPRRIFCGSVIILPTMSRIVSGSAPSSIALP